MERKAGGSLNSVFPGGLNWFKIDLSHHWDDFWISAFGEERSVSLTIRNLFGRVLSGFIELEIFCCSQSSHNSLCAVSKQIYESSSS